MVKNKNYNKEVIKLHHAFCDHCSTIEGESELSRNGCRMIYQPHILYLHIGAVMRDLAVEQYLTQKDMHSSNHFRTPHVMPLEPDQNATTDYNHHCTVSD